MQIKPRIHFTFVNINICNNRKVSKVDRNPSLFDQVKVNKEGQRAFFPFLYVPGEVLCIFKCIYKSRNTADVVYIKYLVGRALKEDYLPLLA